MPLAPTPPKPIWLVARWMIVSLTQPPPYRHRLATSFTMALSSVKR